MTSIVSVAAAQLLLAVLYLTSPKPVGFVAVVSPSSLFILVSMAMISVPTYILLDHPGQQAGIMASMTLFTQLLAHGVFPSLLSGNVSMFVVEKYGLTTGLVAAATIAPLLFNQLIQEHYLD